MLKNVLLTMELSLSMFYTSLKLQKEGPNPHWLCFCFISVIKNLVMIKVFNRVCSLRKSPNYVCDPVFCGRHKQILQFHSTFLVIHWLVILVPLVPNPDVKTWTLRDDWKGFFTKRPNLKCEPFLCHVNSFKTLSVYCDITLSVRQCSRKRMRTSKIGFHKAQFPPHSLPR